jgi:hypothetical protein
MKKILAIFLSAGFTVSLLAQAAGTQPRESQPIVVESEDAGPKSTPVVRTITTKKGYATTTTVPETVTTVTAPEKVLVREGLLTLAEHRSQKLNRLSPDTKRRLTELPLALW